MYYNVCIIMYVESMHYYMYHIDITNYTGITYVVTGIQLNT